MRNYLATFLFILLFSFSIQSAFSQIDESKRYDEKEVELESQFLEGSRQLVLGQYEEAIKIYTNLVKKDKDNAVIHFQLSRCYEAIKDTEKAIFHGNKSIELDPSNEYYFMQLAESYELNEDYNQAANTYLAYTKQDAKDPFFYERAVYFFLQNNDELKAISVLESMQKKLGIQEQVSRQLHEIYVQKGDEKNAAKQLDLLAKAYPKVSRYQLNLANYYLRIGQDKKANKIFKTLKKSDPSVDANIVNSSASKDKRVRLVQAVRAEIPANEISIDQKVKRLIPILQSLNDNYSDELASELVSAAKDLVNKYTDDPKPYALLADIYNSQGQANEAIEAYQKTIQLNSSVFDVWIQLMSLQKDQNLVQDLAKTSDQAILRFPNQALAYLYNGYALNRLDKANDAKDILMEAVYMTAGNDKLKKSIQTELAYSEFVNENYDKALELISKNSLDSAPALELQGDIAYKKSNISEAVNWWKKALKLDPENQAIQTKIQNKQI